MTQFVLSRLIRRTPAIVSLALLACGSPDGARSANADPFCAECALEMESVLELRAPVESEPTLSSQVVRDSRGRFYVSPLVDPSGIAVFDEDGSYVRTLGRRGEGPGEFIEIRDVAVGPGDSLHVLHDGRITIYSPDHEYVRSLPSEAARMSRALAVTSEGTPITARSVSAYGEGEREFVWRHTLDGPAATGLTMSDELLTAADLTVAGDSVWLLFSDYTMYLQAPGGEWQVIATAPEWYTEEVAAAAEERRRAPTVATIMAAEDNIWILSYEFGPRPSSRAPQIPHTGARKLSASEFRDYARPRFDVYDRSGKLVATQQLSGSMRFIDAAYMSEAVEDSLFNHSVVVHRYGLRRSKVPQ